MKEMIAFVLLLFFMISGVAGAYDTLTAYGVSQSFDLGENYYNLDGSPDISATIIGSNEFDRGQAITLNIDLINNGKLLGFENDRTPDDADEIYGAQTEMKQESAVVDAACIVASLSADPESPIEIRSVSQKIGSIRSGQNTVSSARFDIKIDKKAKNVKDMVNPSDPLSTTDSVVSYETTDGDIEYSDALQAPVDVKEPGLFQRFFGWI